MMMRGIAAAALLAGCLQGSVKSDDPGSETARSEFDTTVAPIFQNHGCNSCHASGSSIDMLSYDSLIQYGYADGTFTYQMIQRFLDLAHANDSSTPVIEGHAGLSAHEQELVLNWLLAEQSERY
ncbi:MAG: hypothetical protein QM831_32745 [Kofleriaceae bacterium]